MDFFLSALSYFNSIGLPIPFCIVSAALAAWLFLMHRRVSVLEDSRYEYVVKKHLKEYTRQDMLDLQLKQLYMENKLGESLNGAKIEVLETRTETLEKKVSTLRTTVTKLVMWVRHANNATL